MSKKLLVGAFFAVLGVSLASACGSSNKSSGAAGGTGGAGGSATDGGGESTAGAGGTTDGGPIDSSGGDPYADVNLDAPYQLPDGGCGQVFCPAAVAAKCTTGFQSLNDCAKFCGQVEKSPCSSTWNALLTCAGPNPDITCNAAKMISVKGCSAQQKSFESCFGVDGG